MWRYRMGAAECAQAEETHMAACRSEECKSAQIARKHSGGRTLSTKSTMMAAGKVGRSVSSPGSF